MAQWAPAETGLGTIIVTGSSGRIGSAFIDRIGDRFVEMGLDREGPPHPPPNTEHIIACDPHVGSQRAIRVRHNPPAWTYTNYLRRSSGCLLQFFW